MGPIGKKLAQLPVHQVRSRIDIIEIEHKPGRVVHWEKLLSALASINLAGFFIRGEPPALLDPGSQ